MQDLTNSSVSLMEDWVEKDLDESMGSSKPQSNSWEIDARIMSAPPGELLNEHAFDNYVTFENYVIGCNIGRSHFIEQTIDGRYSKVFVPTGSIGIFPYQIPIKSRWDSHIKHLYINLMPELLVRHSEELFEKDAIELISLETTVEDLLMKQLCLAIKKELIHHHETASRVYIQSMADALSVHLLKNYSVKSPTLKVYSGGLSPKHLKLVREYINDDLAHKISLDELAQLIGLSRYHFSRSFKISMELSPHQYIIKQRVERAVQL